MSDICKACGQEILDTFSPILVETSITSSRGHTDWGQYDNPGMTVAHHRGFPINLVASKVTYDTGPDFDSFGWFEELPQGTEFDTYLIFEVDGKFYRKAGLGDSYGCVTWGGPFTEVARKTKTVYTYE